MKKVVPFLSSNCGDPRLHILADILDGGELHRDRRLGGACLFRVNPTALLEFVTIATSFANTKFKHLLVLSHTDCAAIKENGYFANLKEKRQEHPSTIEGDIGFNTRVLSKLEKQAKSLPFPIKWHFGVALTHEAEKLTLSDSLEHVINNVILWPFGKPPAEIFREGIQKVSLESSHPLFPHAHASMQ